MVITAPGNAFTADGGPADEKRVEIACYSRQTYVFILLAASAALETAPLKPLGSFLLAAFAGKESGSGNDAKAADNKALDALAALVAAQFIFNFLQNLNFLFFLIDSHSGVFLMS